MKTKNNRGLTKTFSTKINSELLDEFDEVLDSMCINKSQFTREMIKHTIRAFKGSTKVNKTIKAFNLEKAIDHDKKCKLKLRRTKNRTKKKQSNSSR